MSRKFKDDKVRPRPQDSWFPLFHKHLPGPCHLLPTSKELELLKSRISASFVQAEAFLEGTLWAKLKGRKELHCPV